MQRILDLDLDFFAHGGIHWPGEDAGRRDPDEVSPLTVEESIGFLHDRCGLRGPLPGAGVEHHGEVFCRWRDAIAVGRLVPPFHVTHVDAHADLGQGDAGLIYLPTELLFAPPEGRRDPPKRYGGLTDGSYFSRSRAGGSLGWPSCSARVALRTFHRSRWKGSTLGRHTIELAAVTEGEMFRHAGRMQHARVERFERRVPFASVPRADFHAEHAFDFVFLARSPDYTSTEAATVFDQVRSQFIDESAF